jgi:hypothetical protein
MGKRGKESGQFSTKEVDREEDVPAVEEEKAQVLAHVSTPVAASSAD